MVLQKLQLAGGLSGRAEHAPDAEHSLGLTRLGAVALGLVAGAAVSAYLWKQRARALNLLQSTPFERAEELLASCENKIADIERAVDELKNAAR